MSRRAEIRMTPEEIDRFLEEERTIVLVSHGPRGFPHPMPMWFVRDAEGAIRMTTFRKSQKVRNIERDPRVALLVEAGERYEELRGVVFYGHAELVHDTERVLEVLEAVSRRYRPEAEAAAEALRAALRAQAAKRVAIVVRPERTVSWDHRKLGGAY